MSIEKSRPPIENDDAEAPKADSENLLPVISLVEQEEEGARLEIAAERKRAVEYRWAGEQHTEAMHVIPQEASGIGNSSSLKEDLEREEVLRRLHEHAQAVHIVAQEHLGDRENESIATQLRESIDAMPAKSQESTGVGDPLSSKERVKGVKKNKTEKAKSNKPEKRKAKAEAMEKIKSSKLEEKSEKAKVIKPEEKESTKARTIAVKETSEKEKKKNEKLSVAQRIARGAAIGGLWAGSITLTGIGVVTTAQILGAQPVIVSAGATFGLGIGASKIILGAIGGGFTDAVVFGLAWAFFFKGGWRSILNSMNPIGKEQIVKEIGGGGAKPKKVSGAASGSGGHGGGHH